MLSFVFMHMHAFCVILIVIVFVFVCMCVCVCLCVLDNVFACVFDNVCVLERYVRVCLIMCVRSWRKLSSLLSVCAGVFPLFLFHVSSVSCSC